MADELQTALMSLARMRDGDPARSGSLTEVEVAE